jgi:hypothetical protein
MDALAESGWGSYGHCSRSRTKSMVMFSWRSVPRRYGSSGYRSRYSPLASALIALYLFLSRIEVLASCVGSILATP